MIQSLLGKKSGQMQGFLEDGTRIPLTKIFVDGNVISQVKTMEKDGYEALQLGFDSTKKATKPINGHSKKAGLKITPRFFRESKVDKLDGIEVGAVVNVEEVLGPGDIVDVTGVSKGKGYAGVVKRHHFKGGPKTHGQSDRHRAPGSIGQSTTPGRVYKGKRMAGRMGHDQVTVKNLEIIEYVDGNLLIKGLVPGPISSIVTITKRGINKKHKGFYKEEVEEKVLDTKVEEVGTSVEEQENERKEVAAKTEAEENAEALQTETQTEEDASEGKSVEELGQEASQIEHEEDVSKNQEEKV